MSDNQAEICQLDPETIELTDIYIIMLMGMRREGGYVGGREGGMVGMREGGRAGAAGGGMREGGRVFGREGVCMGISEGGRVYEVGWAVICGREGERVWGRVGG